MAKLPKVKQMVLCVTDIIFASNAQGHFMLRSIFRHCQSAFNRLYYTDVVRIGTYGSTSKESCVGGQNGKRAWHDPGRAKKVILKVSKEMRCKSQSKHCS